MDDLHAAQIRAAQTMRQAALNLSAACIKSMRVPDMANPIVTLHDALMLDHGPSLVMNDLLRKLD